MNYVALLRGINVSGKNKVPMKELASICEDLGWGNVRTYLQTGNVVFSVASPIPEALLEKVLEQAVEKHFGFAIPVIVRDAVSYGACVATTPFMDEVLDDASRVLLFQCKETLSKREAKSATKALQAKCDDGEKVSVLGSALWIYFSEGIGSSKLTPAVIDGAMGSPATGRNWNTVSKILDLLSE